MAHEQLGAGIALTQEFDLKVTSWGDIGTVVGTEELGKDLAYFTVLELSEYVGTTRRSDPTLKEELRVRSREILLADERVSQVNELRVDEPPGDPYTVRIRANITTIGDNERVETVIPLTIPGQSREGLSHAD